MLKHRYNFEDLSDLSKFNHELDIFAYTKNFTTNGLNLEEAYKNYFNSDPKVFYMAIDIKLCIIHLFTILRSLNHELNRDDLETLISFHRNWINFITIYRSFYDKYMNLVVYTGFKNSFKDFDKAKSKNTSFKKILVKQPTMYSPTKIAINFPIKFVEWSYEFLNKINSEYRTAEIHGDGSARKWVFSEDDLSKTPIVMIDELINNMAHFLQVISCILVGKSYAEELKKGIIENVI